MISEEQLLQEIRSLITEIGEIDPEKLTLDVRFIEDLGMDSMMALEILAALEKKYRIRIPEDKLRMATTLRGTIELVRLSMEPSKG